MWSQSCHRYKNKLFAESKEKKKTTPGVASVYLPGVRQPRLSANEIRTTRTSTPEKEDRALKLAQAPLSHHLDLT